MEPPDPDGNDRENSPREDDGRPCVQPGPDPDPGFYERALHRMPRWIALFTAVLVPFVGWYGGTVQAASFLAGAILGYWNYVGVCRVAERLSQTVSRTGRAPRFNFRSAIRLLFVAAAGFVIIRFTHINLAAAFLGLFTPVAAVMMEILFELGSLRNRH
jgi:ATP synthase I chain